MGIPQLWNIWTLTNEKKKKSIQYIIYYSTQPSFFFFQTDIGFKTIAYFTIIVLINNKNNIVFFLNDLWYEEYTTVYVGNYE